jgi:hypothetical protein
MRRRIQDARMVLGQGVPVCLFLKGIVKDRKLAEAAY